MTNSCIVINKLVVLKDAQVAYEEEFHAGLNIIRGDNSVGKTTILDMIYYILGAEIKKDQWVYPSNICTHVIAEFKFNSNIFTLKRAIALDSISPTEMYSGSYIDAMRNGRLWHTFGPRRSENKASFSQQLFDIFGWENTKSDDYANLTMHNILRMLYADQETAGNKFFKAELPMADSENQRLAIAEFMLGLDNLETHNTRQELLKANRDFDKTKSELDAIYSILGADSGYSIALLEQEIIDLYQQILERENLKKNLITTKIDIKDDFVLVEKLITEIENLASDLIKEEEKKALLGLELADCDLFDQTIKFRKKSLLESQSTLEAVGSVKFEICPSCHAQIAHSSDDSSCHLCHSPHDNDNSRAEAYLTTLTELQFHEKNNITVRASLSRKIGQVSTKLKSLQSAILSKRIRVREFSMQTNIVDAKSSEISREIGFVEAQIEMLKEKADTVRKLDLLREKKNTLSSRIIELDLALASALAKNANHREKTLNTIADKAKEILEHDTDNEESFKKATKLDAEIDFAKDRWLLDGRSKFSGSSMVIKKNALHLSCLHYSLNNKTARYPRFLMLDGIEEGGMTEVRSQNFQKVVYDLFSNFDNGYQIIMTTAKINPLLNRDDLCVGPFYEKGHYTLNTD